MSPKPRDSEEARARRQHDHFAEVDWELEEFEREMALRFVMRDLQLGLEDRRGRTSTRSHGDAQYDVNTITRADSDPRKRSLTPWLRAQSSNATLQPLTRLAEHLSPPSSPPLLSSSPAQSSFPPTPRTPHFCAAPPTSLATPERPIRPDTLLRLLRPSPASHKPSPSVLSLSSHLSSCTSTASVSADTDGEADPGPSASARSLVSQFGQKIRHGFLPGSPYNPSRCKTVPTFMEITPPGVVKKRRVSVPVALAPKKRRLIVRGIKMDDDYAVEGVRRWANVSPAVLSLSVNNLFYTGSW